MQNATLTKKPLTESFTNLPKEIPKIQTIEKTISDWEKIIEIIRSRREIIKQFAPKILHTILTNQLEQMSQEPKQKNTKNQNKQKQIMELTEQIITKPPFFYFSTYQNKLFTPDEVKHTIYKYNEILTEITDTTIKTGNVDLLNKLTNILRITANYTLSD